MGPNLSGHPAGCPVDDDALGPESPGVLDLVPGDEPTRARDDPPPAHLAAVVGQEPPHGPGRPGSPRLGRDLAVGQDVPGSQSAEDADDGVLERRPVHRSTLPDVRTLTPTEVREHVARIGEDGYTIVEDAVEDELLDGIDRELRRLEVDLGIVPARNDFEGTETVRIYNLLVHGNTFEQVPVHPNVLPIVEGVLDDGQ